MSRVESLRRGLDIQYASRSTNKHAPSLAIYVYIKNRNPLKYVQYVYIVCAKFVTWTDWRFTEVKDGRPRLRLYV